MCSNPADRNVELIRKMSAKDREQRQQDYDSLFGGFEEAQRPRLSSMPSDQVR
jgi:hypothetical protein